MVASSADPDPLVTDALVAELRAAGCVFAEEEAALLLAECPGPALGPAVARRVAGEPLEQVLGWVEFDCLRIRVRPGVFVPRRRTEALVQLAVDAARRTEQPCVVDLCCGTGALGAAVAARVGLVELHAADLDPDAVACARLNLPRAEVHTGDLYDALPEQLRGRVDVLVVNAPYVPTGEIATMPPEARLHEHLIALDGGSDGLDLHRRVAAGAPEWLAPGGVLLLETSRPQAAGSEAVCVEAGLVPTTVVREHSTVVRAISAGSASSGTMDR